jgi:hypothetical protein
MAIDSIYWNIGSTCRGRRCVLDPRRIGVSAYRVLTSSGGPHSARLNLAASNWLSSRGGARSPCRHGAQRHPEGETLVSAERKVSYMAKRRGKTTVVERVDEIPVFASEEEEARYWSEHELGDELLRSMEPLGEDVLPPPRAAARPVSIRFETQVLDRLRDLARLRGMGYQTLLKQFVLERLYEEEQREGLVGPDRRPKASTARRRASGGKTRPR